MRKLLRTFTVLGGASYASRFSKPQALRALPTKTITNLAENLPSTIEDTKTDVIDYFEYKWENQREKLLKYPEHLKEKEVQKLMHNLVRLSDQQIKDLVSQEVYQDSFIRKLPNRLSTYKDDQTLIDITNFLVKATKSNNRHEPELFDKIQDILTYKDRAEYLTIEQVADLLWNYAYVNRGNRAFFRMLETAIIDYDLEAGFDYRLLGKILWGLSHNDKGTTAVYSKIAKIINKLYTEISPIKLAEYSFYFSKATESIQGGFGVYQHAEKSITDNIRYFTFEELVKTAEYLFPQNIGTNEFHALIEKRMFELYPSEIIPSTLVSLCKSTAYHKFQNAKLVLQFDKDVIRYFDDFSNSQLETIIWSYIRNRRANEEFLAKAEVQLLKRLKLMTVRGVVFTFYDLSLAGRSNPTLTNDYREYFENNIQKLNTHYLTKVLVAVSHKPYDEFTSKMFSVLTQRIIDQSTKFRKNEAVKILEAIYNYPSANLPENAKECFKELRSLIISNMDKFTIVEICKLFFLYSESSKLDAELEERFLEKIQNVTLIPKAVFPEAFYTLTLGDNTELAQQFIPIIDELGVYGDVKYFFEHSSYIRLIWSLAILGVKGVPISSLLTNISSEDIQESLFELDPNSLKPKILKLYLQLMQAAEVFGKVSEEHQSQLSSLKDTINKDLLEEYYKTDPVSKNENKIKEEMANLIVDEKLFKNPEKFKIYINSKDEYLNMADLAITDENNQRVGILLLNEDYYLKDKQLSEVSKFKIQLMEQIMKWKIFTIDTSEWISLEKDQKLAFLRRIIDQKFPAKIDSRKKSRQSKEIHENNADES